MEPTYTPIIMTDSEGDEYHVMHIEVPQSDGTITEYYEIGDYLFDDSDSVIDHLDNW